MNSEFRRRRTGRALRAAAPFCGIWPVLCIGCLPVARLPNHPVQERTDSSTRRSYYLYVPSTYSDRHTWPLVVACHGTLPYDTATYQMQEWAQFAEDRGIIVAAPILVGTKGDWPPPPADQIARQLEDEKAILSIVNSIKREYKVAEEQVFMTGWSAGAYAILHTGLRNPDVFRALMIRQGNFDPRFMDIDDDQLDRWQQVLVIKGHLDVIREQTEACIKWLRSKGQFVQTSEITGSHRRIDPSEAWDFFRTIVKTRPWIRMRAYAPVPAKPLTVLFNLDSIPEAERVKWFFGDEQDSREVSPTHTYGAPGDYRVTVNVELGHRRVYSRQRTFHVGMPRE